MANIEITEIFNGLVEANKKTKSQPFYKVDYLEFSSPDVKFPNAIEFGIGLNFNYKDKEKDSVEIPLTSNIANTRVLTRINSKSFDVSGIGKLQLVIGTTIDVNLVVHAISVIDDTSTLLAKLGELQAQLQKQSENQDLLFRSMVGRANTGDNPALDRQTQILRNYAIFERNLQQ